MREADFGGGSSVEGTPKFRVRKRGAVTSASPLVRSAPAGRPERLGRLKGPGTEPSTTPGPIDFRGGRVEIPPVAEGVDAWLWRRFRDPGAGGGGMAVDTWEELLVSLLTSLCRRIDPDRAVLPPATEPFVRALNEA